MVRVAQQDLGADRFEIPVRDRFHGALRADRHERRRRDFSMRRRHHAAACAAIAVRHAKSEACHRGENSLQSLECDHSAQSFTRRALSSSCLPVFVAKYVADYPDAAQSTMPIIRIVIHP